MAIAVVGAVMTIVSNAPAEARSDPRRAQAERLVVEGRCGAALELLSQLARDHPGDATLLLWSGRCEIEEQRYDAASESLRAATALAPGDGEIRLALAIALYHREEYATASVELEEAARLLGDERAEIALYRGLLLLAQPGGDRAADAAAWLERARELDAPRVEPVASYYAGLGWSEAEDPARARASLARVVREWPGTEWAAEAEKQLAALGPARPRVWGSLRAGVEYDSNAVLQGQGVALASDISSKRDVAGVWQGVIGSELFRSEVWAGGAALSYAGVAHARIESFDSHFPGLNAWIDRKLDEATTLRAVADTGYAWVDAERFLWTYRGGVSAIRAWGGPGTSELYARFWRDDFFQDGEDDPFGPPGVDEGSARNRDGNGVTLGVFHSAKLPMDWPYGGLEVRGGYQYERFVARGTEYTYQEHALAGGVRADLPWRFVADVSGSFAWRPYRHPSTFPDPGETWLSNDDRNETTGIVDVALERPLTAWLTASARWRYERNKSNTEVFDYDRHIVGAYLSATFGP
jgi:tetratricopeptide (TPR) repeat protein